MDKPNDRGVTKRSKKQANATRNIRLHNNNDYNNNMVNQINK